MILIKQDKTEKLPGYYSLFVSFKYNPDIVAFVKNIENALYNPKTKTWQIPLCELKKLLLELAHYDDIKLELCKESKQKDLQQFELSKYKITPYDYQYQGIQYGLNHSKWLLLDSPGLGKTLQIIHIAEELKKRKLVNHCLIICGVNTLKTNWKKQIEKHSDLSAKILGQKISKQGKVSYGSVNERIQQLKNGIDQFFIITNIQTLRNDQIVKIINNEKNKIDMLVVDEIHACKSPTSIQGKNLLKLKTAKYKIGATGTLLLNSPVDCYVPLKWTDQQHSNYTNFKYFYCRYGGPFNNILLGYKHTNILKDQLQQCSLRRTKDLLKLPQKTVIDQYIEMQSTQNTFYQNIKKGIISQVDKVNMSTSSILSMVARLRQTTECPSVLTTEDIPAAKIERAIDLTKQLVQSGQKVVIFTTFKQSNRILYNELKQYGATVNNGDVPDQEISKNIDNFQNDKKSMVFIATWSKCGTGITLTSASNVIFVSTPWTSGVYEQAQDRCHRIGSNKPVFIYNLITSKTIDERVLDIVNDKKALSDYVIDDKVEKALAEKLKQILLDLK